MANSDDKDGGWAWIILIVASLSVAASCGLGIVGGIFQVFFLEQFRESISYTAWVTALFSSLLQLAGPVASLIVNYFSCRTSVMLGSMLMSLGLVLSSFGNSIEYLMITFGIISGLGLGLIYTPSIIITNYYFHSKRNIMTGVVMSAAGVGIFAAPLLSRQGGLGDDVIAGNVAVKEYCQIVEKEPFLKNPTKINENEVQSKQFLDVKDSNILKSLESVSLNSQLFLSRTSGLNVDVSTPKPYFLRHKQFIVFCISLILVNAGFGGVLIHYPHLCESKGASKNDVALAISANGPALVVSRVLVGALGNADNVDFFAVYISLKALAGIFVCLVPIFNYSIGYSVSTMIILALTNGGSDSLAVGLTLDCVGFDQFAVAVGVQMVCAGIGYLIAPPIIGWVVDVTGSNNTAMFIAGGLLMLSAFVCLLIPLLKEKDAPSIGYHPQKCQETVEIDEPTKS
ncbi:hypothetical protein LOTGIDRAFT_163976 [Lottia gigantea]|uniref:Major facilitator superfamily (MFS) profile domain-containing protein n=1 Tax=Lottia gigantea TaxID=225164 RepID=V3ZHF5_LOTGI|nr:hypothetical protein LOTGIDRAFT_163976 [Lottia gigantea]ESO90698.1 hypothetical protein LOTGIDRAFT_163976 [Lottia gigantea]